LGVPELAETGDANANVLTGGTGRNILIGGSGGDTLDASRATSDNLLIGGRTDFDPRRLRPHPPCCGRAAPDPQTCPNLDENRSPC
jgi:hypothetical protein